MCYLPLKGKKKAISLLSFLRVEMRRELLIKTVASVLRDLCCYYQDVISAGFVAANWDSKCGG